MDFYQLNICGYNKKLPIVRVGPKFSIASFTLFGDVDLVETISTELVERIKYLDFDFLVGTEIKVLPLIYQMSHLLGQKNYIVARTRILGYMVNPIKSDGKKPLVLNGMDADKLKRKKVVLVNDVVATGRTVKEMENLLIKMEAKLVAVTSVIKQGEQKEKIKCPFYYLETLPLFYTSKKTS